MDVGEEPEDTDMVHQEPGLSYLLHPDHGVSSHRETMENQPSLPLPASERLSTHYAC